MKSIAKRILCVALSMFLLAALLLPSAAANAKDLQFHADGTFRILLINDFQDDNFTKIKSLVFLHAVLAKYRPDLVVMNGDQLSPGTDLSALQIKFTLSLQLLPLELRRIPFLFTYGNHDHDHDETLDRDGQAALYDAYRMCYASHNGPDAATYNNVIYSADGTKPVLNIYMMDSNEWFGDFMNSGINKAQLQWYQTTSNALKEANGGKVVPSLLFQHIPVKEMFRFLKEVPADTEGAVDSLFGPEKYILDPDADLVGDRNVLKEPISCENPKKSTGQYEAWVAQGDIIGAYFGHDHTNTFVGRTEDGIVMGYNGGFGFDSYGDGNERFARIFDFKEDDVENYTQTTLYYSKVIGENKLLSFWLNVEVFFQKLVESIRSYFQQ